MAEPRGPTKRDWVHWLHLASRHRPTAQNWPSTAAILPATSISPPMGERHGSIKLVQERGLDRYDLLRRRHPPRGGCTWRRHLDRFAYFPAVNDDLGRFISRSNKCNAQW